MEMYIKVNGKMIKQTEKVYTFPQMGCNMMGRGWMISKMGMVSKHGKMGAYIRVATKKEKKRGMVNIPGMMVVFIKETG